MHIVFYIWTERVIAIFKENLGKYRSMAPTALVVVCLLAFLGTAGKEKKAETQMTTDSVRAYLLEEPLENTAKSFLPFFSFVKEEPYSGTKEEILYKNIYSVLPFYQFGMEQQSQEMELEDRNTFAQLMEAEGRDEETRQQEIREDDLEPIPQITEEGTQNPEGSLEDMMRQENENALELPETPIVFVKHEKQYDYDWEALKEYDTLRSTFYSFAETTTLGSDYLNVEALQKDLSIDKTAEGPQILIYHTHSQEAFADSVPGDANMTIQGVGEHLAQILREEYGYDVLHHTGQYDVNTRDKAYSRALPEIEQILAENPSIQVVIDLHRDSSNPNREMVVNVDGRPTARFMFFNGISRTKKNGEIQYLKNPNLADNLAFSFQMQQKAGEYYPGLTRKIYVREYRYNMHVKPRTLLIELGDNSNTVEEVMNACDPLAHILDLVLSQSQ